MAGGKDDSEDQPSAPHEPRECMPCRGTGRVISKLGGETSTVACPWCEGSGVRRPDIDAQARWPANPPPPQAPPPTPTSAEGAAG